MDFFELKVTAIEPTLIMRFNQNKSGGFAPPFSILHSQFSIWASARQIPVYHHTLSVTLTLYFFQNAPMVALPSSDTGLIHLREYMCTCMMT